MFTPGIAAIAGLQGQVGGLPEILLGLGDAVRKSEGMNGCVSDDGKSPQEMGHYMILHVLLRSFRGSNVRELPHWAPIESLLL